MDNSHLHHHHSVMRQRETSGRFVVNLFIIKMVSHEITTNLGIDSPTILLVRNQVGSLISLSQL
jgi:hypothetical protein